MPGIFHSVLIASFWGGCLSVLFLLVNLLFKKKLSVSWHYYIWVIVIARLLIPVFIPVYIAPVETADVQQPIHITQTEIPTDTLSTYDNPETALAGSTVNSQADKLTATPIIKETALNVVNQFFEAGNLWLIWFAVAVMLFSNKLLSYFIYTKRLRTRCIQPSENEMKMFVKQKELLSIKRNVGFYRYKEAQTPFAMGFFNLMVILPDKGYTDKQLGYILQHELTHIKRHDIGIKWIFEMAKAIHWFNPLIYFASKNASFYCEASCDAEILSNSTSDERKEYGITILELISQAINPNTPICVSMHSGKSDLKRRIQLILNIRGKKSIAISVVIAAITFILCACSSIQLQETAQAAPPTAPITTEGMPSSTTQTTNIPSKTPTLVPPAPEGFTPADRKELCYTFLIVGIDEYNNTDTIMVASYDGVNHTSNVISIPRDCLVDVTRLIKKINAAYPTGALEGGGKAGGIAELQKEIKTIIGFIPDYYVLVNFEAVTQMVDAVGGIEADVPCNMIYDDPVQNLHINLMKGPQNLDGAQALTFARYRKGNEGLNVISDYDRINNQQTVIKAVLNKLLTPGGILKASQFIQIFNDNVYSNLTSGNILWFAGEIKKINGTSALSAYTMPTGGSSGAPMYYELLDEKNVIDLVNKTINPYTKDIQEKDVDIIKNS